MFIIFYLKMFFLNFYKEIRLRKFQFEWIHKNKHNNTFPISIFNKDQVSCGMMTYGKLNVIGYNNPNEELRIGNYVSLSDNVTFLLGGEHHPEYISNFPFKLNVFKNDINYEDNTTKGAIIVNDDVWIGRDVLILSGVSIGQGAIIAAGSVITKDIPPYAIASTNRIIKFRFSSYIIKKLINIDYSKLRQNKISNSISLLYTKVDDSLISSNDFVDFINLKGK